MSIPMKDKEDQALAAILGADADPTTLADQVIDLERRLTRAAQRGAGISLKPHELDLLAATGAIDCVSRVKSQILKEKVKWRQREASTSAARSPSHRHFGTNA